MGNEESLQAGAAGETGGPAGRGYGYGPVGPGTRPPGGRGGPGGEPGGGPGIPIGSGGMSGHQTGNQPGGGAPSLSNFGLGNLSNLGNNLSNTMSNLRDSSGALLRPPGGSANSSSLNNLANLGSNLTSNLSNLGGNLTSNLSNIGGSLAGNLASNLGGNSSSVGPGSGLSGMGHKPAGPMGLSATAPAKVNAPQVPDIDLSGLTEEEKAKIQSVMMRAQEAESGPGPAKPTDLGSGQPSQGHSMQTNQLGQPIGLNLDASVGPLAQQQFLQR